MRRRLNDMCDGTQYMSPEYFLEKAKRFAEAARASLNDIDDQETSLEDQWPSLRGRQSSRSAPEDYRDQYAMEMPDDCYLEEDMSSPAPPNLLEEDMSSLARPAPPNLLEEVSIPLAPQSFYHPDKKRYLTTPYQPPKKTNLEWFPKTSPHARTVQDPETGQYYEIVKEYDEDGVFQLRYIPLVRRRVPHGRLRYVWERDEEY